MNISGYNSNKNISAETVQVSNELTTPIYTSTTLPLTALIGDIAYASDTKVLYTYTGTGWATAGGDVAGKVSKSGDTMSGNLNLPTVKIGNTTLGSSASTARSVYLPDFV